MQPTIVFTAPVPGMIFINGRFAGETGPDRPLMIPAAPCGAVYAEYRPLAAGQQAAAFKCVFSNGRVLPDSLASARGVSAVEWPGHILEIEVDMPEVHTIRFTLGGAAAIIEKGPETRLFAGMLNTWLPDGALIPRHIAIGSIPALFGETEGGGQYLVTLTEDMSAQTGMLTADRIDFSDDTIYAATDMKDVVGHGRLEKWAAVPSGLQKLSSENLWASGTPQWPESPTNTVIAAVEAALASLFDEAEGYFVPALRETSPLNAIGDICALCLPMKYALPDTRPCVGLLSVENERFARIKPLYYKVRPGGTEQGPWQIEHISLE